MKTRTAFFAVVAASLLCSCVSGPVRTHFVSSPTGARIEIDGDHVGDAPFVYTWPRKRYDRSGHFADETMIRAYPSGPHQFQQRKFFESHHRDLPLIPREIYFDMSSPDISRAESE